MLSLALVTPIDLLPMNMQYPFQQGVSIAVVHDYDDDGQPDILAGSPALVHPQLGLGNGRIGIYSSATGKVLKTLQAPTEAQGFGVSLACSLSGTDSNSSSVFVGAYAPYALGDSLENIYSSEGTALRGAVYAVDLNSWSITKEYMHVDSPYGFGEWVLALQDLDGDGQDDLLVGAPASAAKRASSPLRGGVYAISGQTGESLYSHTGHELGLRGFSEDAHMIGDLDGDGHRDGAIISRDRGKPTSAVMLMSAVSGNILAMHTFIPGNSGWALAAAGPLSEDQPQTYIIITSADEAAQDSDICLYDYCSSPSLVTRYPGPSFKVDVGASVACLGQNRIAVGALIGSSDVNMYNVQDEGISLLHTLNPNVTALDSLFIGSHIAVLNSNAGEALLVASINGGPEYTNGASTQTGFEIAPFEVFALDDAELQFNPIVSGSPSANLGK